MKNTLYTLRFTQKCKSAQSAQSAQVLKVLKVLKMPKVFKVLKVLKVFKVLKVMSPDQSDQMSQWYQVSRIALCIARSPIELFWTAKNIDEKTWGMGSKPLSTGLKKGKKKEPKMAQQIPKIVNCMQKKDKFLRSIPGCCIF